MGTAVCAAHFPAKLPNHHLRGYKNLHLASLRSVSLFLLPPLPFIMVAHDYPQSEEVHSSPVSVRHYQTRDHSRNNPQLAAKPKAETDRHNMMSDAVNTSVPLLFDNMMKIYLPSVDSDGFDAAYPNARIERIRSKFLEATKPRTADNKDKRQWKEKIISEAWVCHISLRWRSDYLNCP